MVEVKSDESKKQIDLADIKSMLERIEKKLKKIEAGMKRDWEVQLAFTLMVFMFSVAFAFLVATLTSGVGKDIYAGWTNYILAFVGAGGILVIGFFVAKVINIRKYTQSKRGK